MPEKAKSDKSRPSKKAGSGEARRNPAVASSSNEKAAPKNKRASSKDRPGTKPIGNPTLLPTVPVKPSLVTAPKLSALPKVPPPTDEKPKKQARKKSSPENPEPSGDPSLTMAFAPRKIPSIATKKKEPADSVPPAVEPLRPVPASELKPRVSTTKETKAPTKAPVKEEPVKKQPTAARRGSKEQMAAAPSTPPATKTKFDEVMEITASSPLENKDAHTPSVASIVSSGVDDSTPTVFERISSTARSAPTKMQKRYIMVSPSKEDKDSLVKPGESKASDDDLKTPPSDKDDSDKQVKSVYLPAMYFYSR